MTFLGETTMKTRVVMVLLAPFLLSSPALAADCKSKSHPESTPTERFTINTDGTVVDKLTGLMWMSCSVGQTWDGVTCTGKSDDLSWEQTDAARNRLNTARYAGHADWRVPVITELASIVELRCFHPRVNVSVFPATPAVLFWSSMEKQGDADLAFTLDFGGGAAAATRKQKEGALRLVRGGLGSWGTPTKIIH
jgi:hypothetical protein